MESGAGILEKITRGETESLLSPINRSASTLDPMPGPPPKGREIGSGEGAHGAVGLIWTMLARPEPRIQPRSRQGSGPAAVGHNHRENK